MSDATPPSGPPVPPGPAVPEPPAYQPPPPPALPRQTAYPADQRIGAYGSHGQRWEPPPSQQMAGWALACALVPCFQPITAFVAIGLGIAVLVKSRDGRNHGKGKAIAALVIAPLWILFIGIAVVAGVFGDLDSEADRDANGHVTDTSEISPFKIRQGDCIDDPTLADSLNDSDDEDEDVVTGNVTAKPCTQPHDFEAYLVYDLTDGDYPGQDEVSEAAAKRCFSEFKAFVGIAYPRSDLEPFVLYPTSSSWRLFDDRSVTCLVGEPGRKTVGSLRGSRR